VHAAAIVAVYMTCTAVAAAQVALTVTAAVDWRAHTSEWVATQDILNSYKDIKVVVYRIAA
jgi:hypothetical protein